MMQETFENLVEESLLKDHHQLSEPYPTPPLNGLTAATVMDFERLINSNRSNGDSEAIMLLPFRQGHQVQHKQSLSQIYHENFTREQDYAQRVFVNAEKLIPHRMSKEMFDCFMIIQNLRKHRAAALFIHQPAKQLLLVVGQEEHIERPLDLFIIVYRLLRGEYSSPEDFELDMLTMIQNAKMVYMFAKEMFNDILRFEYLYWHYKDVVVPSYAQAIAEFAKLTRIPRTLESRNRQPIKDERQRLQALIKEQSPDSLRVVMSYLELSSQADKFIQDRNVDLSKVPLHLLREVEELCQQREEQSMTDSQGSEKYYTAEEICENLKTIEFNVEDIQDDDDDE